MRGEKQHVSAKHRQQTIDDAKRCGGMRHAMRRDGDEGCGEKAVKGTGNNRGGVEIDNDKSVLKQHGKGWV
jgi:hypothetical protein